MLSLESLTRGLPANRRRPCGLASWARASKTDAFFKLRLFSHVPVPVPEKYCFNIISVNLVYPVFKLILLRIYFIFTFCFVGLNLNILLGNYPFYVYKTKDLENLKKGDFAKIFGQNINIDNN